MKSVLTRYAKLIVKLKPKEKRCDYSAFLVSETDPFGIGDHLPIIYSGS
ncbi:hypothetical protein PTUN_a2064 [Pseudoalteromonas tunicata]|nr:hypothetical protein PTUN_a2064 [Pseudoalteromonas tunicata]